MRVPVRKAGLIAFRQTHERGFGQIGIAQEHDVVFQL